MSDTSLKRQIGLFGVVTISLSSMLGSGIFLLPALAAESMGNNASGFWLAYVLAATVVLPGAFSKSELGTAMPSSGGSYTYLQRTFGSRIGTISGIGLWSSFTLKSTFALIGFAAYVEIFSPGVSETSLKFLSSFIILLLVGINIVGVKQVKNLQIPIVFFSVGLMVLICIYALLFGESNISKPSSDAVSSIRDPLTLASTTALVFVSFAGVTKIAAIGGEVKNPSKNLPRGMLISLAIATILYASVSFTIGAVLEDQWWVGEHGHVVGNPIALLAKEVGGNSLAVLISILAVLTMISMALAGILASSRFLFAMSRDNLLPSALEDIQVRFETPHISIIVTGTCMFIAIWTLDVHSVAELASGFKIMIFMIIHVSLIVLRSAKSSHSWYKPEYNSPLYPWIQLYGIFGGLLLIFFIGFDAIIGASAAIILGLIVYGLYGRKHAPETISPWKTLQTMLTNPEKAKREVRTAAFSAADVGKKNHLTLSEFFAAMEALGWVDQRKKLRELFHAADSDDKGYLIVNEFLKQVDSVQESE